MNERRVSLGNRALSLLLALVMVIGMLPLSVFSVFAAPATDNSTTANNVAAVKTYAENLLNSNFSKVTSKDAEFSWDKEKKDAWRYFNGVVMDAMLMLGVDSDAGNALEFVSAYYDTNITSSGYIARYGDKDIDNQELDSIRAARGLVNLLGTSMDKDKYETALHNIYAELASFPTVSGTDGNYRHKDNWTSYEIGLDGLYMAQPFMAAYAKAIDDGLIENTKNVNTVELYADIADRMLWVANNMSFTDASGNVLLNHGYDGDGTNNVSSTIKGNGVVWSRGVGWYLAALVDVIELMPDTADRDALIAKLPTLFDGMLAYQHADSGMWYNVVYATDGSNVKVGTEVSSSNYLEVSGTALIAYAMLKAYNNGWVSSTYKTEGLEAFNGMFSTKNSSGDYMVSSTAMNNIYKSAGVANYDGMGSEYCSSGTYVSGEGKGVGPVIMAAAQASKAISAEETFVGVVDAADMTIALGTAPSYKDVKITVVGSQGTVKTVPVTDSNVRIEAVMAAAVGDTAGNATATVYYSGDPIGTFNIAVVDTTTGETVNGTISVPTGGAVTIPSAPSRTESGYVEIKAPSTSTTGGTSATYVYDTEATTGNDTTVFTNLPNSYGSTKYTYDGTTYDKTLKLQSKSLTIVAPAGGTLTVVFVSKNASEGTLTLTDSSGNTVGSVLKAETTGAVTTATVTIPGEGTYTLTANGKEQNILVMKLETAGSGGTETTVPGEYAKLVGTTGLVYPFETASETVIADLKKSTAFKVLVADNVEGTGAEELDGGLDNGRITITKNSDYKKDEAKVNNFSIKLDGKEIGTIPVTIYDNSGSTTNYTVYLTVTPVNMVMEKGNITPFYAEVKVTDANGNELNGWNFFEMYTESSSSVATVDGNQVTGASAGSATITVTLNSVTDGTNTYTLSSPISKTIAVTVTEPHSHSYTSAVTTAATCTTAGTRTYTCSCGESYTETIAALGHNYENGACTVCGTADPDAETPVVTTPAPTTTAPEASATGNISTSVITGGTVDNAAPSRNESGYVEIVAPSTSTAGGTSTSYTFDPTNGVEDSFFTYPSDDFTSNRSYTYNGVTYTKGVQTDSSGYLEFTTTEDGTLTVYMSSGTAGRTQLLINTSDSNKTVATFTVETKDVMSVYTVELDAGNTYRIKQGSGTCYVVYANYTTSGGSGGTTTTVPGEYAKLVGTTGLVYPFETASETVIADLKKSTAFKVLLADNAEGTGAEELDGGLDNGRITITKNSDYKKDEAKVNNFSIKLDGKEIGTIPVKIYDPNATTGGTTTTTWYNGTLTLDPTSLSMTVGDDAVNIADSVSATAVEGGAKATINSFSVNWTSSDNDVATVDSNGNVTAKGAGTATITATLSAVTVNGETGTIHEEIKATATVTVSASTGGDTPATLYSHNFTTDGDTDPEGHFTFSGSIENNTSVSGYNRAMKINSSAKITFTAPADGVLNLVFTGDTQIKINGELYERDGNLLSIPVSAGTVTIERDNSTTYLYELSYATGSVVTYSLSDLVFDPSSITAGESTAVSTTVTASDGNEHTYTLQWVVNSTTMGDTGLSTGFRAMDAGEYTVTATLTHVDGTELATPVTKTGTITIGDPKVTGGALNNASVTVTQGTNINLSALSATINYANDTSANVNLSQSGFTYKVNGSDINITDVDATAGTHTVAVYYNGVSIGNLTVTVNEEIQVTDTVTYVLDTDGIDAGEEYIVVAIYNGKYYAMGHNASSTTEKAYAATINGDKVTIDESNLATALWKFEAVDGKTGYYYISNGGYYVKPGGSTVFNTSKTATQVITHDLATGQYRINVGEESKERDLYLSSTSNWERANQGVVSTVYLYKKVESQTSLTLGKLPMLYVGGTPYQAELNNYVTSVKYNGTTYEKGNYVIEWSTNDTLVAYISGDGQYVNGAGAGTTQVVAKLISVGGVDVSAQNITATTDVMVTVPSLDLGEDVNKFVGDNFKVEPQVLIGSTVVDNYKLSWSSSNESVATVDQEGNVSVIGAGSAVISAQIVETNGNNISNYLTITDSFTVNAEVIAITSGKLSSDTVTVAKGAPAEDVEAALSGIALTLTKNNGDTILVPHDVLFEDVDLSGINTAVPGTYNINVTYEDPDSDYVFAGIVSVKVIDESLLDKEGIITVETNVTYVIDTDGIDVGEEYVIVRQNSNGEWVALMNPDATGTSSVKGSSQVVTRSGDGTTITISQNANLVRWIFAGEGSSKKGDYTYTTFSTISNNARYLYLSGDNIVRDGSGTVYTYRNGDRYYIAHNSFSSNKSYPLTLDGTSWTRGDSRTDPSDTSNYVYLYKKVGTGTDYAVGFQVSPTEKIIPEGTSFTVPESGIFVQVGETVAESYKIEWTTSNKNVATVDENGKITAVSAGDCIITATLVEANGSKVINNSTNAVGIPKEIAVSVQADQLTYTLLGSPLTVPLGGEPDFSKVSLLIDSTLAEDITVSSDQLVFKYIDAVVNGFDTNVPNATCTVDVYYNGNLLEQKLVLKVADNAYDGLDEATSYPEYPDPGAVRMNKFATGININKTGVAKIELNAAGISSRKPVDVILIVDVSNSMNWSMDWFEGMTEDEVKAANDAAKTDSSKPDKLDMAMTAAQNFAAILMENNVAGSDANNTMTFVTFGGNDKDRNGTSDVDSVVTAFIGEDTLANVNNSFANTMFTGSQKLAIAGTDGNAIVSGSARGNTIYDAAFVEAIAAVEQLKIAKAGSVAAYDASGREIHIVFMTDGAPSHYNDKCYDNSNTHGGWFTKFSPSDSNIPDDTEWLNFIKNPNDDATELYSMVTDFHIVGYDLAHGGFGSHNWIDSELGRVLGGLVENKALDYTLATDTDKLNAFFDELGHSLAYAGTHALVTDIVSEEFILQTDPIDLDGLGEGTETLAPSIQILERKLVVRTDIGKKLMINGEETVITEQHLGMYVDGGEDILATVTFDTTDPNDKKAFSSALDYGVDIWDDETNIITGKYFTYSFSNKTFEWHIGNIEDTEIALTYYGYLEGALEADRDSGLYKTNEEATLKYINTDNQIVIRKYPVPQVAWGEASVAVRFFLVDEDGNYTNLAGNTFTNPANRVFLTNRAYFDYALNELGNTDFDHFTGSEAFAQALISGQYALYDDSLEIYVLNSTAFNGDAYEWHDTTNGKKTADLVTFQDMLGDGSYIQTTVDIPVVVTGRLGTDRPLAEETVVLDFARPIDVQLFNYNELLITNYGYKMELYGFAAYDPAFDTHLYLLENEYSGKELAVGADFNAGFGHFKIVDKAKGIIEFHPTSIAHGPVQVFGIAKITQLSNENNVYYLYNTLNIVPATTVYYETDFADGVFITEGSWTSAAEGNLISGLQDPDPDVNRRDEELEGAAHIMDRYGFDSSYVNSNLLSGGTSLKAAGAGVDDTTVTFSFTGTGFDIISRTGAAQGMIRVNVTDSKGNLVKTVRVTNQGTNELYQIPVVSVEGLDHGTYTVEIGVYTATNYPAGFEHLNRGNEFHFDAVRIYNTAKGNKLAETEYKLDGEFAPSIQEVRDLLITKDEFTAASGKTGAVWLDPYGKDVTVGDYINTNVVSDYKTQGPNNEVYLGYGQGIAFEIESSTVPATVQIGAKSITGNSVTLNAYIGDANSTAAATLTKNIAAATDLYYELSADYATLFADGKTYVVVWNTSSDVLSITDIKVGYTTDPAQTIVVSYSEEMATFASNLLVTAVEQDDPDMTVAKGEDGKYYYYVADRVNEAYTGLVELDNGTWYVQDGQIVFNFDGAITFQGETYYIKAGRVSETTTGLYKYTGEWMYYTSGKVDTAYTGLAERNGMTVYVANGTVDFTKTGAVSHDGKLYYVRYGVADSSFTGLVRTDDGAWVYVTAGQQDTAYTGIVAHSGSYWYVENGAVNFAFTGTVADANGDWTVNRGQATAANN